eukprot:gene18943-biopygen8466
MALVVPRVEEAWDDRLSLLEDPVDPVDPVDLVDLWVVVEAGREVLGVEQVDQGVADSRSLVWAEQTPAEAEEAPQIQDAEAVVVEE